MIAEMKYNYKLSMPLLDEYLKSEAIRSTPELFGANGNEEITDAIDLRLESSYSTNGWDTVSVCSVSDLNRAITTQKTYPLSMEYKMSESGVDYTLSAKFKPWSIAPGGDGKNINLRIPVESGAFCMGGTKFKIEECEAIVQAELQYFPYQAQVAKAGEYNLKLDTNEKGGVRPVSVISFKTGLPSLAIEPIAQTLFANWINSESTLKLINILFATAQVSDFTSTEFKWLVPTYSSYAYTDISSDPEKSKFGVLCMLNKRTPPYAHQMPAIEFEKEQNFAFLINREIFVKNQLLPSLPQAFEGAKQEDFTLKKDNISIEAKNLDLPSVRYGAIDYHPKLDNMCITVSEYEIRCTVDFTTEISPGIVAHTYVETKNGVKLGKNDKGEAIMEYTNISDPITRNQTDVSPGIIVTEVILEAITAIVAFAIGKVVTTILRRVIVAVVVVIVCAVISITIHLIIEKVISEGVQAALPSIMPMASEATKYVKWPFLDNSKEAKFDLKTIKLNGTLSFTGVLA